LRNLDFAFEQRRLDAGGLRLHGEAVGLLMEVAPTVSLLLGGIDLSGSVFGIILREAGERWLTLYDVAETNGRMGSA
jgi:hypothetical protein